MHHMLFTVRCSNCQCSNGERGHQQAINEESRYVTYRTPLVNDRCKKVYSQSNTTVCGSRYDRAPRQSMQVPPYLPMKRGLIFGSRPGIRIGRLHTGQGPAWDSTIWPAIRRIRAPQITMTPRSREQELGFLSPQSQLKFSSLTRPNKAIPYIVDLPTPHLSPIPLISTYNQEA